MVDKQSEYATALGIFCGLILLALLATVLAAAFKPLPRERRESFICALICVLVITLAKFALLPVFPGYESDLQQFVLWGSAMAVWGPAHIYDPVFVCKYTPAYLYPLWAAAASFRELEMAKGARLFIESPPLMADLLLGLTVFAWAVRTGPARLAVGASLLFALNPALLYATVVWGQNDSVLTLAIALTALMAADSRYGLAGAMAALAVLIKAQGIILLPILGWWLLLCGGVWDWIFASSAFAGTFLITILPFQIGRPWGWILTVYANSLDWFPRASVNAFNLMALLVGMRTPDSSRIAGLSAFTLGISLFAVCYCVAVYILWRKPTPKTFLYSIFLIYLGLFVLAPRVHERYLYFALAILAPLALDSYATLAVYIALSGTLLFNLICVKRFHEGAALLASHDPKASAAALVNLGALIIAAVYGLVTVETAPERVLPGPDVQRICA